MTSKSKGPKLSIPDPRQLMLQRKFEFDIKLKSCDHV